VSDGMEHYGAGYSSWALLWLKIQQGEASVKICGAETTDAHHAIRAKYYPTLVCSSEVLSKNEVATFEVCKNQVCHLPVNDLEEAFLLLK
jgi:uncharacterized protein YyaL (SSP411 family)